MKSKLAAALLIIATAGTINTFANITIDKSNGVLTITSDISGIVFVKIIDPNDKLIIDKRYEGNSFSWIPSSGPDGAYRYDVHIVEVNQEGNDKRTKSDYAGGSVEVVNGELEQDQVPPQDER